MSASLNGLTGISNFIGNTYHNGEAMGEWSSKGWRRDEDSPWIKRWQDLPKAGITVLADTEALIDWFDDFLGPNKYAALSNYFRGEPIALWGFDFATGEHAFQAAKAMNRKSFDKIRLERDTDTAKQHGQNIKLRLDWEDVKVDIMRALVATKFAPGRKEARVLEGTGDARLVEGSLWDDTFWGVDLEQPRRPGQNRLGKLLTTRRKQLVEGRSRLVTPPALAF